MSGVSDPNAASRIIEQDGCVLIGPTESLDFASGDYSATNNYNCTWANRNAVPEFIQFQVNANMTSACCCCCQPPAGRSDSNSGPSPLVMHRLLLQPFYFSPVHMSRASAITMHCSSTTNADCFNISRIAMPAVKDLLTITGFVNGAEVASPFGALQKCATNFGANTLIEYRVRRAAGVEDISPDDCNLVCQVCCCSFYRPPLSHTHAPTPCKQIPLKVSGAKRGVTVSHENCTLVSGTSPAGTATGIASLEYSCKLPANVTATTVTFTAKGGGCEAPHALLRLLVCRLSAAGQYTGSCVEMLDCCQRQTHFFTHHR